MLWLSRKDIEHISRRLLRDYLKKVPQKVDHIDPTDFAEKMCGLQFTFADISEAHDAIGLTATSGVIITIPQRDGTRLDYELDGKTAFIDQSLVAENQIGRLNFTMMHEAAHQLFWMLYPEEYEVQTPRCVFRMADEHTQYPVGKFLSHRERHGGAEFTDNGRLCYAGKPAEGRLENPYRNAAGDRRANGSDGR